MKNLKLMLMLVATGIFLVTSSCEKEEIKDLNEDIERLEGENATLTGNLANHYCMYGYIKIDHDLHGYTYDTTATAIATSLKYYIWYNTTTEPASPTVGADQGPLYATVRTRDPGEGSIYATGLPLGQHYVYAVGAARDSSQVATTITGGKVIEILDTDHCISVHIHTAE